MNKQTVIPLFCIAGSMFLLGILYSKTLVLPRETIVLYTGVFAVFLAWLCYIIIKRID